MKCSTIRALTAVLAAVLFCSCAKNPQPEPAVSPSPAEQTAVPEEIDVEQILSKMTLEEKVGQMMVPSFRIWKVAENAEDDPTDATRKETGSINITQLNDEIRECIRTYHFGGTVLFAENYRDAEQVLRLVADIQEENKEAGGLPLLVATDQEGGNVSRITFGTTGVSTMGLGAVKDAETVTSMARIYGEELHLLGINTDFAPVIDVNNNPNNPVIGIRSFSDSTEWVSNCGLAYMKGLQETGTIATAKHFPGHGDTGTDSHTGFPLIERSYEELAERELVPFQNAIDAGVDMIMTAHIQYPKIEDETYVSVSTGEEVYLPATMSDDILTDLLRNKMGFQGVIVTDALDMGAITDNFAYEDVIRMTINAGADLIVLPIITDTDLFQQTMDSVRMAIRMVNNGEIPMERIDESVRRILTVKKKYGLLGEHDYTVTDEMIEAAELGINSQEHRDAVWKIAEHAVTLLQNSNDAFPLSVKKDESVLLVIADTAASRVGVGDLLKEKLEENKLLPEGAEITTIVHTKDNHDECLEQALQADHVILLYRSWNSSCLDPSSENGISSVLFDEIIEQRHAKDQKVILISGQLPYDAARFPKADAILLAYYGSIMRNTQSLNSGYAPNILTALCTCFGMGTPGGSLPVNIPSLDSSYHFTDTILYPRAD